MKHIHFDIKGDGFYGAYWVCKDGSDCAVIAMLGDDPEDYMARSAVKWLLRLGVNVLTINHFLIFPRSKLLLRRCPAPAYSPTERGVGV